MDDFGVWLIGFGMGVVLMIFAEVLPAEKQGYRAGYDACFAEYNEIVVDTVRIEREHP